MDDGDRGGRALEQDGRWIAFLELLGELEALAPGISRRLHDRVVRRLALADVVRLHGAKTEPAVTQAYADAERHLGLIAVVAPKLAFKMKKRRR